MGEKLFAISKTIVKNDYMMNTYMPALHHTLLPTNLRPMTSVYLKSAHDALLSMISSMDGASGPLKTFIIPPAYRAGAHAGFGPRFPAEKSHPFFQTFDESFYLLGANIPRMFLSKPLKAWEQLVDLIEGYVAGQEKAGNEMSPFVQIALDGMSRDKWVSVHATTPTIFFILVYALFRHPETWALSSPASFGLSRPTLSLPPIGSLLCSFNNPRA